MDFHISAQSSRSIGQVGRALCALALLTGSLAATATAQQRGPLDLTVPPQRTAYDYTNTIQTIISRAGAGGTVRFAPGTYLISSVSVLDNQRIIIPAGAILLRPPNSPPYLPIICVYGKTGVTIEGGGAIDGNKSAHNRDSRSTGIYFHGSSNCTVRNLRICNMPSSKPSGSYGDGITVGDKEVSTNLVFDNLFIFGCERHAIFLGNTRTAQITNCRMFAISGDPGSAINLEPDVTEQDISDILIERNTIFGCVHGITGNNGYERTDRDFVNIRVLNNTIFGNQMYGIAAGDWGPGCEVSGNSFDGNGGVGIYMRSRFGVKIENNWVARNGGNGLSLVESENFVIRGNRFVSNGGHGCEISKNTDENRAYNGLVITNEFWNNSQRAAGQRDGLRVVVTSPIENTRVLVTQCQFGNVEQWGPSTQRYGVNFDGNLSSAQRAAWIANNQFMDNLRQ